MAEHLNQLSCLIVEDLHGTFLAHIFKQLATFGRLSHFQVAQRCHLPIRQVKSGLAALIQLRLVQHHTTSTGFATYQADIGNAYDLVRTGKVVELANAKIGPFAATVVEQIAGTGYTSTARIADQINELLPDGEKVSTLKINRALRALASYGFLKQVRPAHLQILHDAKQDTNTLLRKSADSKIKGKKAQEQHDIRVRAQMQQNLDTSLPLESIDVLACHENGINGTDLLTYQVKDDTFVCIDFDATVRHFRQNYVSEAVEKALGPKAARVAHAVVSQVESIPPLSEQVADALRPPSLHTLAVSKLHANLSDADLHVAQNGDHNTNGSRTDVHMTNGIDESNDHQLGRSSLDTSLSLIAEGPFPFLTQNETTSAWEMDDLALSRWIRDKETDRIVLQRVGPVGLRVKRMLTSKGKLEEKNIQDLGLLVAKELRQTLAQLQAHGLVELQEVPREAQRQPNRTMFLWFFDAERAKQVLLGDVYKTMARLFQVLRTEREGPLRNTLEKLARANIVGDAQDYLIGEERTVYMQWRRKELWLIAEIERLDDSVALLRDM